MVLDMGDEDEVHLILGRPFLNTTSAIIYMKSREIHFQFLGEKVHCYFNSYATYEKPKKNKSRRCHSQRQKKQATKDGWTNYPREVSRYEDRFNDENKSSPEEEVVPPLENVPVTVKNNEDTEPQNSEP
jgi:hypothetical protein